MSFKQTLKNALRLPMNYYAANFGEHTRTSDTPRLWILMYHRILPKNDSRYVSEEPGMIVEPDTFRMHLREIQENFSLMRLGDWLDCYQQKKALPPRACAITFDDGWRDNFDYAFPILQEFKAPATLFAVSDMLGTKKQFWPNRLARLLQGGDIHWLKSQPLLAEHLADITSFDKESLALIISRLKNLADDIIIECIAGLERRMGIEDHEAPLMDWQQLQTMVDSKLVDVGSHTQNHFRLKNNLASETLTAEITQSKSALEEKLGLPIKLFCYPNGDASELAVQTTSQTYQAAVTTQIGINFANNLSLHQLKRIPLHNDVSNTPIRFKARLARNP